MVLLLNFQLKLVIMKKMNISGLIGIFLLLTGFYGCIDDRGNYDYLSREEVMPVSIDGLQDTTVEIMSVLKIAPVITGMTDESKYSYLWYAANSQTAGLAPTRDTLSLTRDLEFPVTYESGTYNLVFEIRDKETDVYVRKGVLMTVASVFAHGWYVLKDENGQTDFDFINGEGGSTPNVIRSFGRQPLPGIGKKIFYQSGGYYHQVEQADGTIVTLVNKKVMHVLTDRDLNILNADNMEIFKTYDEAFYEAPVRHAPQNCCNYSRDVYLINAGKMHSIYGMSANIGKFPYEKTGDYALADDMVGGMRGVMVWDTKSRSFLYVTSSGASMNEFANQTDVTAEVQISPSGMEANLVRLLSRVNGGAVVPAYAVMKNPGKEEYYLADIKYDQGNYPFVGFDTIPAECGMPRAEVMAAGQIASCIYFAKGSELWVYKNVKFGERESKLTGFPGEDIVFLSHFRYTYGVEKFNQLVVVTSHSAGWKLYRFDVIGETPEIETTPAVEPYTGQGNVRDVIFRN